MCYKIVNMAGLPYIKQANQFFTGNVKRVKYYDLIVNDQIVRSLVILQSAAA